MVPRNLHRELMAMTKPVMGALGSRPDAWRAWLPGAKRLVRRALGSCREDLYDLHAWTVFTPKVGERPREQSAREGYR
jgi:hypothetical protein